MYRFFTFILVYFVSLTHGQAQQTTILIGQLIDSTTQVPIPFAHVRLKESISITNHYGIFSLNKVEYNQDAELKISCIGYKTLTITASYLQKHQKIMLMPETKLLNEVVISELSPQTIFKRAEKNGFKNYKTSRYSSNYTFDQLIFYESADTLIALSKDSGELINMGLDTTGAYPIFKNQNKQLSEQFLKYDTLPNEFTFFTRKRNTITPDILYSYDPVRVGILKKFHPVPTMFSKDFYATTNQEIISIVNLDEKEYYLIGVYPKTDENNQLQSSKEATLYKNKLKELIINSGINISSSALDSMVLSKINNKKSSYNVTGFFLVNTLSFGISNALIKVNTFDASGKLHSKLHVAASYVEYNKSFYLQNLDVLVERKDLFFSEGDIKLYYLLSLKLSNFKTEKVRRVAIKNDSPLIIQQIDPEMKSQLKLENFKQFLMAIKDCASCKTNPMKYFNQRIEPR